MGVGWDRLESMARSVSLADGLAARVADPLWMLARQRQVGEFRGDDAAQPAAVRVQGRSAPLATFRPAVAGAAPVAYPAGRPLETLVESGPEPDFGSAGLFASARAGRRLSHVLRDRGLGDAVPALRAAFPLMPPDHPVEVGTAGRAVADLLVRHGIDGATLAGAPAADVSATLASTLVGSSLALAEEMVGQWRAWYGRRNSGTGEQTWNDERLEYAFEVGVRGPHSEIVLTAPEHDGGHLDWFSFDVTPQASHGLSAAEVPVRAVSRMPSPVRYTGMPASRWWELEDGQVHFGDVEAGPTDLARLLVAEFATVYRADWFVVPLQVPVGSLTELSTVEVFDTFGGRTSVPSTAWVDHDRAGDDRAWRLFEMSGDTVGDGHPAPWLFVTPSLVDSLGGPALERVAFTRDEAANLAWGIERVVEGPLGRGVDRAEAWYASHPRGATPTTSPSTPPSTPRSTLDDAWTYQLASTAPPWWVPLVAEQVSPDSTQIRLRRARMQSWARLGAGQVGPKSVLLDPRRPRWLSEEEVPTSGVNVDRSWRFTRWHDGSGHLWLQRHKRPGRGEASSGVRWDLLTTEATEGAAERRAARRRTTGSAGAE